LGLVTCILSDVNDLFQIEEAWDSLVHENSDNPFLLSRFIKGFMEVNRAYGWHPHIILVKSENDLLAIAPLMIWKKLGFNSATSLVPNPLSPDIIVRENCRKSCISEIINLLVEQNIRFLDLTQETCSPNLLEIQKQFQRMNFNAFYRNPGQAISHNIIDVKGSWDTFCSLKGRLFRKELRRYKRKLNSAGSWRVNKTENIDSHVVQEILDVERKSWKQDFRKKMGIEQDETLRMLITALQAKAKRELGLTWEIWFLYLNNQAIAYCLVLRYKKKAFIVKGSYDKKWKHLYPGIYIRNEAIKSIFGTNVESIDFLTDLPYHRKWASRKLHRIRIVFVKGLVPNVYMIFSVSRIIEKLSFLLKRLYSMLKIN